MTIKATRTVGRQRATATTVGGKHKVSSTTNTTTATTVGGEYKVSATTSATNTTTAIVGGKHKVSSTTSAPNTTIATIVGGKHKVFSTTNATNTTTATIVRGKHLVSSTSAITRIYLEIHRRYSPTTSTTRLLRLAHLKPKLCTIGSLHLTNTTTTLASKTTPTPTPHFNTKNVPSVGTNQASITSSSGDNSN